MSAKELNIGDYVRTKNGIIWKPNKIEEIEGKWFFDDYYLYDKDYIKSSPNIIDLIQEGDYVNGDKVIRIFNPTFLSWGELPYVITQKNKYELDEIKSIVTKEQFESIEYKIGE